MEGAATVSVLVAFAAGLLSFLSPCVFPLIPSYVSFLTGLSLEDAQEARRTALVHGILFVSGFTLIFLALGATATALGAMLFQYRDWIARTGGVLIIIFGLHMLGVFNIGILSREARVHVADKPVGYLGSALVGVAFGAGWTPCVGPVYGMILTLAAREGDFAQGMLLLFAYSMGLAVPFLLAAVLLRRFLGVFTRMKRTMGIISRVSGVLLIAVGLLLVTDYFTLLATWLARLTPDFILERL